MGAYSNCLSEVILVNTYKLHFASDDKISTLDKKSMFFFFSAKHVIATYLKCLYGVLPMSAHVLWRIGKI